MSSAGRGPNLRGRAMECGKLEQLISAVTAGSCQVLVLRGEAGVGKTALLRYVTDLASEFRIVQLAGVESDMELAFAGLQQLCAPLLNHLDALPAPQREALNVAFGRVTFDGAVGKTPDRFLVGLAVLSLLAAAARKQPVLCIIDDAQWLDQVSVQTLAFVARRLLAEPVALMFGVRDSGTTVLEGLPELVVSGLSDGDARDLLDTVLVGGIDPRVRDRIIAETRGIPLALLEVPRNVSASDLAGGFWISQWRSSAGALEEAFVQRIRALPEDSQRLVLVAAAEPVGDAALFLRAAARLGIAVDALGPAETAGVIEFGPRMRFQHPLMRSAAYRAAELTDRRAVHRVLAEVTDPKTDPDRRAWHAANAAAGPDDAVAADLESSAARAQSRGGIAAAATFLERATALTSDPRLRSARALEAAKAKRDAAAPAAAHELLVIAEIGPLSDLQQAQADRLRAQMEFVRSRAGDAGAPKVGDTAPALLNAARRLENLDDFSARESYLEAIATIMSAGRLGAAGDLAAAAEAACAAVGRVPELPRPVDLLLKGFAKRITDGPSAGAAPLRITLEHMGAQALEHEDQLRRWLVPGFPILQESAAWELWDEAIMHQLSTAVVRYARRVGALAGLPQALVYRAGVHILAGEFATAASLLEEADSIAAATDGYSPVGYQSLLLAAWRGVPEAAVTAIDAAAADGSARGEGRLVGLSGHATALLYNGLGRYEEALAAARRTCEYEDFGFYNWSLYELVEAATHAGDQDGAVEAVRQLQERAGASGTDWGLGVLANAQALVAADEDADSLFATAIEHLAGTRAVVYLARAHLGYGEWLRRVNRRIDARRHLSEAHELFGRMGAQAFMERARRELVATGEKVRKQPVSSGGELTSQETQIARLAGDGLTNPEIAAQLFISTHTVEWHLRKVFAKLGISSRRQLRTVSWAS